jgi:DNA-binding response OmpR family regulator
MHTLIIDDDATLGNAFARVLERAGFTTVTVGTAYAGLTELDRHRFAAIVCDFALPVMDGATFYDRLCEVRPDLADRVIFVTGWAGDEKTRRLIEHSGCPFLQKPVELKDLVAVVRRVAGVTPSART